MSAQTKTVVTRTVTVSDLTPQELASIFAQMDDTEQAAFFDAIYDEAAEWPGTGWSGQALAIIGKLDAWKGMSVMRELHDHFRDRMEEMAGYRPD